MPQLAVAHPHRPATGRWAISGRCAAVLPGGGSVNSPTASDRPDQSRSASDKASEKVSAPSSPWLARPALAPTARRLQLGHQQGGRPAARARAAHQLAVGDRWAAATSTVRAGQQQRHRATQPPPARTGRAVHRRAPLFAGVACGVSRSGPPTAGRRSPGVGCPQRQVFGLELGGVSGSSITGAVVVVHFLAGADVGAARGDENAPDPSSAKQLDSRLWLIQRGVVAAIERGVDRDLVVMCETEVWLGRSGRAGGGLGLFPAD